MKMGGGVRELRVKGVFREVMEGRLRKAESGTSVKKKDRMT